jgi:LEA14-like dessication related protein
MKNSIKYLLGGAIAYYAFVYFRKGSAAKTLNVKLRTIKLQPISEAALIIEIINPNNASLNINSITADVSINNFALSTLNYQQPATIQANSSRNFELRLKINPLEAFTFIANLFTSKKINEISLNGTVSAEGFTAPINITQNLTK